MPRPPSERREDRSATAHGSVSRRTSGPGGIHDSVEKACSPPKFRVYCQGRAQDGKRGPERKGDARVGGRRGCEVLEMAANELSFGVGIVLPLGGALWQLLH